MEKISYEKLMFMLEDLKKEDSIVDVYFKNSRNYEFDSYSNMLCFLLLLYKYKSNQINIDKFSISRPENFEYFEFLRRIDDTIMRVYCLENKNLKQEVIYCFYLDYIHINYIIKNYAEVIRCCKNMELIFPEDDKIMFYKLLYLYENIDFLTNNININHFIFVKEFDRYLYNFKKSEFTTNPFFYSKKINLFNDLYNLIKANSSYKEIVYEDNVKVDNINLDFLANYKIKSMENFEIQKIKCKNINIQDLTSSLISDYLYCRTRFLNIKQTQFYQNEILSIQKALFSIYDKIAYILFCLYNISNRNNSNIYFKPSFFTEAKLNEKNKLLDLPNPFIKTLYLYSNIYALDSNTLSNKWVFSIGNWNYAEETNILKHRSTSLIKNKKESSLTSLFYQTRNSILILIKLIKFEFPEMQLT